MSSRPAEVGGSGRLWRRVALLQLIGVAASMAVTAGLGAVLLHFLHETHHTRVVVEALGDIDLTADRIEAPTHGVVTVIEGDTTTHFGSRGVRPPTLSGEITDEREVRTGTLAGPDGRWVVAAVDVSAERQVQLALPVRTGWGLDLRTAITVLMGVLFGGLLLTAAVTAFVTRAAMRPLEALETTAIAIIRGGDLSARVPPPSSPGEPGRLAVLFNDVLSRVERQVRVTREALDALGHDLRTPLTRLRIGAERRLLESPDPERDREALADVLEETDRVLATLAAITDVSRAESGTMQLERSSVDLADLVAEVVDTYEFVAEDKDLRLVMNTRPAPTCGDPTRLRQAIANLVDNAIKFSPPGSAVTIRTGDQPTPSVEVEDRGPGVPEEEWDRIWDRLYRAKTSRGEPGLGLGLSLVRAVVTAHGGRVFMVHAEQPGARFRIELPADG